MLVVPFRRITTDFFYFLQGIHIIYGALIFRSKHDVFILYGFTVDLIITDANKLYLNAK